MGMFWLIEIFWPICMLRPEEEGLNIDAELSCAGVWPPMGWGLALATGWAGLLASLWRLSWLARILCLSCTLRAWAVEGRDWVEGSWRGGEGEEGEVVER